jgi:hypothetical protein
MGTLIYPYLVLMEKELQNFQASLPKPTPSPVAQWSLTIKCIMGKLTKK